METSRVAPQTTSSEREARPDSAVGACRRSFVGPAAADAHRERAETCPSPGRAAPRPRRPRLPIPPDAPTYRPPSFTRLLRISGFRSSFDSARSRISYRFSSRTFSCASASTPASISTSPAAWRAARKCASRDARRRRPSRCALSRLVALRARDAFFPPLVFARLPLRVRDEL
jgi:hypothetical protein